MNTLHLKYAIEVARTQSFTQAAENLFMAQPNLSKAIKELEQSLDITIFERSTKGVMVTEEGSQFLEYARNVIAELERMNQISKRLKSNNIRICVPQSYSFNDCVTEFMKINKDVTLEVDVLQTTPLNALSEILYSNYRMAVIRVAEEDSRNFIKYCGDHNLKASMIWKYRAGAIISTRNQNANKQILTNESLKKMVRLCQREENLPYHIKDNRPRMDYKKSYISDLHTCTDIINSSCKYWMLDSPVTRATLKKNQLVQMKTEDETAMFDYFVFRENYDFSYAEKLFLDCVYSVKNTIDYIEKVNYQL